MSLLCLFEISTTEGWVDVMYAAVDSTDVYVQPMRDTNLIWVAFFVVYIFFMTMFLINLSVGIIVERFLELKSQSIPESNMTEIQKKWSKCLIRLYRKKENDYFSVTNLQLLPACRRRLYDFVCHRFFDRAIMAAITFNTLLMSLKIFPQPTLWWNQLLDNLNYFFAAVFLIECILKLCALRLSYFKDNWNVFDFVCVSLGIFSLILAAATDVDLVAISGVVRIFRIARLFKLMRSFKKVNKIFMALIISLPKLANVMAILLLVLTLYGILGVSLFSTAKKPEDGTLNYHGNFDDFWKAFITLFRSSTGEAWNELMHDLRKSERDWFIEGTWCSPPDLFDVSKYSMLKDKCMVEEPNACVQPIFGANIFPVLYFFTYVVICLHLMMNLVIAVILDGYEEGKDTPFDQMYIEVCIEKWKKYDSNLTLKLPLPRALTFIEEAYNEILEREADQEEFEKTVYGRTFEGEHTKDFDISKMPMRWVKCLDIFVSKDNQVGFLSATKTVHRFALTGSDMGRLNEMHDLDAIVATPVERLRASLASVVKHTWTLKDKKTAQKLKTVQRKEELMKDKEAQVNLAQEIAVTKLQRAFRRARRNRLTKKMTKSMTDMRLGGPLHAAKTTGSADEPLPAQAESCEGSLSLESAMDKNDNEIDDVRE
jgi:hypothetical protein